MKKFYFLFILFTSSFVSVQAQLLVEQFDYTAGSDVAATGNGWGIHSGGRTTNPILTSSAGLTFNTYSANSGNAALVNNTGIDLNRQFSSLTITSGDVYASFLVNLTGPAVAPNPTGNPSVVTYFFHLGYYNNPTTIPVNQTSVNSAFRGRVHAVPGTDAATQFKLGLTFNANEVTSLTNDLTIGTTYLVVVKYSFITGDFNDTVSLFVFPAGATLPSTEPTPTLGPLTNTNSGTPPAPTADASHIQLVALRQFSANQRITVDGIVVRTNWDLTSPLNSNKYASKNNLELYPNPSTNGIVNLNIEGQKQIQLFDTSGREVLNIETNNNSFNIVGLNSGIYMARVTVDNVSKTSKLVIK